METLYLSYCITVLHDKDRGIAYIQRRAIFLNI
jgi:hypothetical protein